jgi:glycosyltransferase involved in cell wall biosynthesis
MRIGIVIPNYPPARFEGGISHYSELLAKNLVTLGHEVFAITSTEFNLPITQSDIVRDIQVHRVLGPWGVRAIKTIKKIAFHEKLDVLVLQYAPALFKKKFKLFWAISRFSCLKVTTFHTLWGGGLNRFWGLLILWCSSKIIATNSEIMSILKRHLPFLLKRTYWIPIATNILPVKVENKFQKESYPIVSYFGMIYPGKGLELILDTLEELKRKNEQFIFKFIGGKIIYFPSYKEYFKDELERRNLNDVVDHLGYVPPEDVSEWLTKSRFVFLPYEQGLSDRRGTFLAAIAHGKPVLTSPPIVPMPILKNGINVIWPNEIKLDSYVEIAQKLLHNDELISKLEKGAKNLSCLFSWKKIAEKYEIALSDDNSRSTYLH